ncbi:MAG: hypothetical protein ACFFD1_06875 [Candidatus Thorarchaeota archaeon]
MSTVPKLKYFGTSGIRGKTLIDITPNFAERMARAYVDVVLSGIDSPIVVIGRDPRYGAEILELALIVGLTACGVSVKQCGIVPTPVLLTYQYLTKADGAIIVTGSHIAPDRIGLIFMTSDGSYCSDHIAFQIEQRFETFSDKDGIIPISKLDDLKQIGDIEQINDIWEKYRNFLYSKIDLEKIKGFSNSVVIDPGNGTAAGFFSSFLKELGINVFSINDSFSPVSDRLSEPIDANLGKLKEMISQNAELGIAFDLDADRVTFITNTETGSYTIPADHIGAFFFYVLLNQGLRGDIVLPVNSSGVIDVILDKFSLQADYCKIGQPGTIELVKKKPNPLFSYEESGKFYFFHEGILWTDGMLTALKLLEIISQTKKSLWLILKDILHGYLDYETVTKKYALSEENIPVFKEKLNEYFVQNKLSNEISRITIDGIRITFFDKSWLLFRFSGTEPAFRLVANAPTKQKAVMLIEKYASVVEILLLK